MAAGSHTSRGHAKPWRLIKALHLSWTLKEIEVRHFREINYVFETRNSGESFVKHQLEHLS